MSKIVAALDRDGLVDRAPDPADARAVILSPTPRGRRLMERGRRQRVERLAAELDALGPANRAALARAVPLLRSLERS